MPSSVWNRSLRVIPSASAAMAFGWSPAGAKSETTLNGGTPPSLRTGCDRNAGQRLALRDVHADQRRGAEIELGAHEQVAGRARSPRAEGADPAMHLDTGQRRERGADPFGGEGGARLVLFGEEAHEAVGRHAVADVGRAGF